jgi:hypothetical protein
MSGRRLLSRALTCAVLLLAVLLFVRTAHAQLLSPGPLSQAHSGIEGDAHCNDCHASGKRIDTGACMNKCHSDLAARIGAGQGLHGKQYKGQACEKCHVEHQGLGARLVRWPGGDRASLDHAQTGWPLEHAHKPVTCDKCHNRTNVRGAKTYLGLSTACTPCHKDPHAGRLGPTCTSCHDDIQWGSLRLDTLDHDKTRYPLRGAHQRTQCVKCHTGQPPKYVNIAFQACTDCHKDPHAGRLGPNCTGCHDEEAWKKITFSKQPHPGVSLANGHAPVRCTTCHDKGNTVAPTKGAACVSCHQPTHKAPFGRECKSCHATIQWMGLARTIGLSAHARTAYSLTGKHVETPCAGCHRPELPRNARYRQLKFERCLDCHQDQHKGEFASARQGECAACHVTPGFRPTTFGISAHAQTTFPLDGAHVNVACAGCHTDPRPRVSLHVTKQLCADCHANPHGDQFAMEMKRGGCAECHITASFQRAKFDHSTWPLTGAHATAQCDSCHHPTPEDRKAGKGASYRGVARNCGGCHDDVHVAQFRTKAPVLECDKCHSTKLFKIPSFDHNKLTAYPLTGGHAKVACDKCHIKETLANGKEAVRYRLPSSECSDCHKNPHGGGSRR